MGRCVTFSFGILAFFAAADVTWSDRGLADVTLQVVNDVDPTWVPYTNVVTIPAGQSVYKLLLIARETVPDFTFEATYHTQWGHHITSINHLSADDTPSAFWQMEDSNGVAHVQGVDWIYLQDGDTVVFRYTVYDPTDFNFDQ